MLATRENIATMFARQDLVLLGIASLGPEQDYSRFQNWLAQGNHAGMEYMERYGHLRQDPRGLLEGARTALSFAWRYGPASNTDEGSSVAKYARLPDYHKWMRRRGDLVWREIQALIPSDTNPQARVCVDTAPLLERSLASRTRGPFIGKNTCLIHPDLGSFLLLGHILTTLDLLPDEQSAVDPQARTPQGGCGTCKRCQVHCPTGALDQDYRLNANLCLSYWTIEHRGPIPIRFWPYLSRYWYGCDICQDVCPYNRVGSIHVEPSRVRDLDLVDVATMNQLRYEQLFGGTPMTRAGRHGLRRNALIALFVRKDPRLKTAITNNPADHPTVRATILEMISQRPELGD